MEDNGYVVTEYKAGKDRNNKPHRKLLLESIPSVNNIHIANSHCQQTILIENMWKTIMGSPVRR